jgi:hypothetical protein
VQAQTMDSWQASWPLSVGQQVGAFFGSVSGARGISHHRSLEGLRSRHNRLLLLEEQATLHPICLRLLH